ncbi:hypothetical protein, partial [Microcoleus sp. POL10_C6]|uniref:hypothetical protein n=1 Tax=Microcoleus sp. POL10_C6 TaxID=2818852 RepID=UPI002FD77C06
KSVRCHLTILFLKPYSMQLHIKLVLIVKLIELISISVEKNGKMQKRPSSDRPFPLNLPKIKPDRP